MSEEEKRFARQWRMLQGSSIVVWLHSYNMRTVSRTVIEDADV